MYSVKEIIMQAAFSLLLPVNYTNSDASVSFSLI